MYPRGYTPGVHTTTLPLPATAAPALVTRTAQEWASGLKAARRAQSSKQGAGMQGSREQGDGSRVAGKQGSREAVLLALRVLLVLRYWPYGPY